MMWIMVAGAVVGAGLGVAVALSRRRPVPSTSTPDAPQEPASPSSEARVLLMGDSHAVGLQHHLRSLVQGDGMEFHSDAVSGSYAIMWTKRMPAALAWSPTIVLISLGGNDYQRTWGVEETHKAVNSIVYQIQEAGAIPVWIEPPPFWFADKIGVDAMWRGSGAIVLPGKHLDFPHVSDNVHYTSAGYREWADVIWLWVKQNVLARAAA